MNLVDVVVLLVVVVAAVQGFRLGAVVQVFSLGGFLGGLYLGALTASVTVRWVHTPTSRAVMAIATMLGVAVACGVAGRVVGWALSGRIHRSFAGPVDSGLGVVVATVAALLAVWLVANTLVNSSSLGLNAALSNSRILRSIDSVLPAPPSVFARVQSFLSSQGFPPVFAQLAPAVAGPVTLPSDAELRAAVLHAGPSTVKIVGAGCGQIQEGSGFVAAPGVVVTNAHVVAGIPHPSVSDATGTYPTTVLLFDPSFDLAVMRVPGLTDPPLPLDPTTVGRGTTAGVLGYPEGGPFTAVPAGVMAEFPAEGRDIYGEGLTVRDVYQIQAIVRPGNSGGPLTLPDGLVVGVVFSRSTTNSDVGYALTSPGVVSRVQHALSATHAVSTGSCVPG